MRRQILSDEAIVDRARRRVALRTRLRWGMLLYAIVFLGSSIYFTVLGVRNIGDADSGQLTLGFVHGLALAVVWTTFGLVGALCLGKALAGFDSDFRPEELLVSYHDRLRDLGQLPDKKDGLGENRT